MLMPQYHRGTFVLTERTGNFFVTGFPSEEMQQAEIIDRLLSYISLQMVVAYPRIDHLKSFLEKKVISGNNLLAAPELFLIKDIYEHQLRTLFNVKVLPDAVFEAQTGITYKDYYIFCARLLAFSEFFR